MAEVVCCGTGSEAGLGDGIPQIGGTSTSSGVPGAWFAGSTPRLTTVVWHSYLSGMAPGSSDRPVRGSDLSDDLWREVMAPLVAGTDPGTFPEAPPAPGD